MLNEAYLIKRLSAHPNLNLSILTLPSDSPVIQAALNLLLHMDPDLVLDIYQQEEYLFRWVLELERHAEGLRHPYHDKQRLLHYVRKQTLSVLDRNLSISELAQNYGVSRSNFSHQFRQITGKSPAAYIREIRLEEAARLLRGPGKSIKEIAACTGFQGSTPFGKAFRRAYAMSPGSYRAIHCVDEVNS
ncbi:MAG: helix-turn-helix transcriptional regulator [Blastochloris sp.]|nr:helix-turn-helix transcriptional regulator [Blastochloris sp.]